MAQPLQNQMRIEGEVSPQRSALMARVGGKHSKPERLVRGLAHRLGFRFRLHRRSLPGSPDLVFPKLHKVIFVHGCFWHRHPGCIRTTTPKTRREYWNAKFIRNVERDTSVIDALQSAGWSVLIVWECETFDHDVLTRKLSKFLSKPTRT
jgi:DNA mismatch endonuclease, patch repair protein